MPLNLTNAANFWYRIRKDTVTTDGDGSSSGSPAALEHFNPDIGYKGEGAATADAGSFSLLQIMQRLQGKFPTIGPKTGAQSISIVPASDAKFATGAIRTAANFTRPANQTAYTGTATAPVTVSNSTTAPTADYLTFTNAVGANGLCGIIRGARLTKSGSTTGSFRLWLFDAAPASVPADGAAYNLTTAPVGYIDFSTFVSGGAGSTVNQSYVNGNTVPFAANASSRNLYGVLTAIGSYTPASAETFAVSLFVD